MKGAHSQFDEAQALNEILAALEYGTKKQENDIINPLLEPYGLSGIAKPKLVAALLRRPGFENFFLEVLKSVRPFSLMLGEIYEFLNSNEVTARRRASKFLIQSEKAKASLTFDLQNFPKELIRVLSETDVTRSVISLRFEGIELSSVPGKWNKSQAETDWNAVAPIWDGNFYDNGFHRALVYAHTVLGNTPDFQKEADTIVRPILERLAAITEFVNGLSHKSLTGGTETLHRVKPSLEFMVQDVSSRSYVVRDPEAAAYLAHQVRRVFDNSPIPILEVLFSELRAFAIANTLWNRPDLRIHDDQYDDWSQTRFGQPLSQVPPEAYIDLLRNLAAEYSTKLDRVAPVEDFDTFRITLDSLVEFLNLPFWKNRWFIYELWTLARTLNVAERFAPVTLNNVNEDKEGILEWNLPGGMAQQPVAIIGEPPKQVLCWTQRKTYHPGTGAGLEPDLRLTKSDPRFHDLIIIENKDRLSTRTKNLDEILDRYVDGTCAESVWLINYETFPESAGMLKERWSPDRVHIVSHFRPGLLPEEFETNIEEVLRRHLEVPATNVQSFNDDLVERSHLSEIVLTWKETPRDLDLHAWIEDFSGTHHIYYGDKGSLDTAPYAELGEDQTQGKGHETLRMKEDEFQKLLIAVNNFSDERNLADCGAEVTFYFGTQRVILPVPLSGQGRWWSVLRIAGSSIEVVQQLMEEAPSL